MANYWDLPEPEPEHWINSAEYFFNTNQEQWMYFCLMRAAGYLEPGM